MNVESLSGVRTGSIPIRSAALGDFWSLYRLEKRCFPADSWPLIDIIFSLILPGLVRLKAVHQARIVGFVLGQKDRGVGWIATFGVDPDFRRRGIGRELLGAAETELGTARCRLCVRASNTAAIRLYRFSGYRRVGTWPRYYRGGENGLVMEKVLLGIAQE